MRLERDVHVIRETEFFQVGQTGIFDHGWRPAHEDLRVGARLGQVITNHVSIDEPCAVRPT